MKITRESTVSGKTHEMEIPVTQEQLDRWNNGMLIQNAMPNLGPDQREFIKTGIAPDEWARIFGD
jgi:hypothetical protein